MIYKHQKKGYNQVLRIWCHGAVFSGMVLFCCLQLTCVGTCPMQCYTLLVLGGKNAFKGTLIWCVRGTQPSVHLSFSQCLQAKV